MLQIDMPMPKDCSKCRFRDREYNFCYADPEDRCAYSRNKREEWCPLSLVFQEEKKQPEPKAINKMECFIDVPLELCGKCPNFSPHLYHDVLWADFTVCTHALRIICEHAGVCKNLIDMKEMEDQYHDQPQTDENTDKL